MQMTTLASMPVHDMLFISPQQLATEDPDMLPVLPWNLMGELRQQFPCSTLVTAIPFLQIWD